MKTELTIQESKHLFKLGVPSYKARRIFRTSSTRSHDIFCIEDLLNILPKEIGDGRYVYWLRIDITYNLSEVYYSAGALVGEGIGYKKKEKLIDALYELTVWCIENGHLKFD